MGGNLARGSSRARSALNQQCAAAEREGRAIIGPGLPAFCDGDGWFLSDDCLRMPGA